LSQCVEMKPRFPSAFSEIGRSLRIISLGVRDSRTQSGHSQKEGAFICTSMQIGQCGQGHALRVFNEGPKMPGQLSQWLQSAFRCVADILREGGKLLSDTLSDTVTSR